MVRNMLLYEFRVISLTISFAYIEGKGDELKLKKIILKTYLLF